MNRWDGWQIAGGTLVVTAVALFFWFLFRFHNVVLMLFAALIISSAIQPLVQWFSQRGLPRTAGVVLIFVLLMVLIGVFFWLGLPFLIDQTATIGSTLSGTYRSARQEILGSTNLILRRLAVAMPAALPLIGEAPAEGEDVVTSLTQFGEVATMGFRTILGIASTGLLAFYWTLESERIKRGLLLLIPRARRETMGELITSAERKMSNYVIGQGVLCLAVGALALVAYLIIGLPHALTLALLAGLMEAVPLLGPAIGAVPAALVAFSLSPLHVLWVLVATAVIQQLENNLLVPRVMNQAIGVRPIVTLLAMFAFGSLFGVLGVLVSIPLAAIIQLMLARFLMQRTTSADAEMGRDKISVLRYQVQDLIEDIRSQVRYKPSESTAVADQIEDSIEEIALDLNSLLAQYKGPAGGAV